MLIALVLLASITLQFVAAWQILRLRQIPGQSAAWSLLALGAALMAARRIVTLRSLVTSDFTYKPDMTMEGIAFAISILMVWGLSFIVPRLLDVNRAREALRESEQRYRALFQMACDGIIVAERDSGRFVYANDAACRMLGYAELELIGKGIRDIHPPGSYESVRAEFAAQARGEKEIASSIPCLRRDGVIFYADIAARSIEIDNRPCVIGYFRDISARRRNELAIKAIVERSFSRVGEAFFREAALQLAELLEVDLVLIGERIPGAENRVRALAFVAGGAIQDPIEYELEGTPCERVMKGDVCVLPERAARLFPRAALLARMGVDGYAGVPLFGARGNPIGIMFAMKKTALRQSDDVIGLMRLFATRAAGEIERLRGEHALRENEEQLRSKKDEIERFANVVTHDLKTPLLTVKGYLSVIERCIQTSRYERMERDIARCNAVADRMTRLLDDLLRLVRVGQITRTDNPVEMTKLVNEAVHLVSGLAEQKNVGIRVASDLPLVHGDRDRLLDVVQNLLENAIKFMGDQPAPSVEIGARALPDGPVFWVRDNGVGVAPAERERIFDLFHRVDATSEGTGAGLAIVRRIIEAHGGKVWVESEGRGKGATFCFTVGGSERAAFGDR